MWTNRKGIIVFLFCFFAFSLTSMGQRRAKRKADKETMQWRYEIECVGTGAQGTYQVKVWSYSKKPHVATEQAKKNAIHGIMFKGFGSGTNGCRAQKPLIKGSTPEEHEKFLKAFFKTGGDFMRFVTEAAHGAIGAGDIIKIKRKEYKVGVIVSVKKDELRRYLEEKGLVKKLGHGF